MFKKGQSKETKMSGCREVKSVSLKLEYFIFSSVAFPSHAKVNLQQGKKKKKAFCLPLLPFFVFPNTQRKEAVVKCNHRLFLYKGQKRGRGRRGQKQDLNDCDSTISKNSFLPSLIFGKGNAAFLFFPNQTVEKFELFPNPKSFPACYYDTPTIKKICARCRKM